MKQQDCTTEQQPSSGKKNLPLILLRGALLIGALVLLVVGILKGDPNSVMNKDIRICLECIGIG